MYSIKNRNSPLRIGHRGAAGYAPENTILSVEAALSKGVDFIEIDVQETSDGYLVLMHDKRVDRTTDKIGYVRDMTIEEIKTLKIKTQNSNHDLWIPTLDEILNMTSGKTGIMLEIISPGIAKNVFYAVNDFKFNGSVIYASFLHKELLTIRRLDEDAKTLALLEGVPVSPTQFAKDAHATHVGICIDSVTDEFISELKNDHKVFAYTVDELEDIEWLRDKGIDGIISNYPDRIE